VNGFEVFRLYTEPGNVFVGVEAEGDAAQPRPPRTWGCRRPFSVRNFSSPRLSREKTAALAEFSTIRIRSSIQKNLRKVTLTDTRLRWLWAPFSLISRNRGIPL